MEKELDTIIRLYKRALPLKELPRTGWIMEGSTRSESDSVAAHSYSVALLSYLTAKQLGNKFGEIKWDRVLAMAVFHDLSESVTGELATGFKRRIAQTPGRESLIDNLEEEVFAFLLDGIKGKQELIDLMHEFNECQTKEAKIVKFADILDAFAFAKIRFRKTFDNYLSISKNKLSKYSPDKDNGVGKHLTKWLDDIIIGWDQIDPKPITK